MRSLVVFCSLSIASLCVHAQAIENVFVETYAVTPGSMEGEPPMTTYRIFIDLAPGYQLQMVYGDGEHQLKIHTSTDFFNDVENGVKFGDQVDGGHLNSYPLALDSWLTIGAASDLHMGVPRHLDTDGSVLECPPYPDLGASTSKVGDLPLKPLCIVDGLKRDTAVREVVDFKFSSSYLGKIRGSELETTDGAWAVLGGMKGVTPENMVLIAQLSTTGELSFKLNVQIGAPDHTVVKYVASDPAAGEVMFEGLSFGTLLSGTPSR